MTRTLPWPVLLPILIPCATLPLTASALAQNAAPAAGAQTAPSVPAMPSGPGRLEVSPPRMSEPLVFIGKPVRWSVRVSNPGTDAVQGVSLDVVTPPNVLLDPPEALPAVLRPGESVERRWTLSADKPGVYPVSVRVRSQGQPERDASAALVVNRKPSHLDTHSDVHPQVTPDRDGNLVFRNPYLVAVVMRNEGGFGPILFYPTNRPAQPTTEPVAVAPAIGNLSWREGGADHSGTFVPTAFKLNGDNRVTLTGTVKDGGTSWTAQADLAIGRDPWLSWEVRVRPSGSTGLTRFAPLPLRTGHAGPREALFPGLEYLEGEEGSSSTLDDHTPNHVRLVPDPYKITVPVMSHSQDGMTVALMWDHNQVWGGPGYPSALFDSPNRAETQTNTRMELFLPSVPRFVHENSETAAEPLSLAANQEVRLSGKVLVLRDNPNPVSAIRQWTEAYGRPAGSGWVRTLDAERALSLRAYTNTLWDASAHAWRHAVAPGDAAPRKYPFNDLALIMEAGQGGKNVNRAGLQSQAGTVLEDLRKEGALDPRLAFRTGGVQQSLDAQRERVNALIRTQLAHGGWAWLPTAEQASLGTPGEIEVGTVTTNALPILRYAAETGDSTAAGSGRKALEFITETFRVPRAAQTRELPLHTPDLLAAAQAAECFLLGYQISGETRYIEQARYWANAGLPFVYLWNDPAHPALNHATLSAFGAAHFTDSRFGQVAQWCGLAYARVLMDLSRVRPNSLYDSVAEGILQSAMRQQYASGDAAGTYPATWNLKENQGSGAKVSPELLLSVLYRQLDRNPDVSHVRVRVGPDRMFVASGADIREANTSAFRMWLDMKWIKGEDTFTTINGVTSRPISVQYNSTSLIVPGVIRERRFLPEAENEANVGWYYDADAQLLILRLHHTGNMDHLEVRWPDSRERLPVKHEDRSVDPRK